ALEPAPCPAGGGMVSWSVVVGMVMLSPLGRSGRSLLATYWTRGPTGTAPHPTFPLVRGRSVLVGDTGFSQYRCARRANKQPGTGFGRSRTWAPPGRGLCRPFLHVSCTHPSDAQ